jgi:hypothetical protein
MVAWLITNKYEKELNSPIGGTGMRAKELRSSLCDLARISTNW